MESYSSSETGASALGNWNQFHIITLPYYHSSMSSELPLRGKREEFHESEDKTRKVDLRGLPSPRCLYEQLKAQQFSLLNT